MADVIESSTGVLSLLDVIKLHADKNPHSRAISSTSGTASTITYRGLLDRARVYADALASHSTGKPHCVITMNRSTESVCAMLGCLMAQCPVALVDPRRGAYRLQLVLQQMPSSLCILDRDNLGLIDKMDAESLLENGCHFWLTEGSGQLPSAAPTIYNGKPLHHYSETAQAPDDKAIIIFTSGSTGWPRGVCVGMSDIAYRARTEADWFGLTANDTVLGLLPLSFDVGLAQLLGTLWAGGHHLLLNSWLPGDIAASISAWSATGFAASPMIWNTVLRFSQDDDFWHVLQKLRYVTVSGGDLPSEKIQWLSEKLAPCGLYKTYGLTEMFRVASLPPDGIRQRPQSVGRPYPEVNYAVLRDDGTRCRAEEIGEIVAWGAGQMKGYLDDDGPCPVRPAPKGLNDDNVQTVLYTGDIGYVDADGYLYIKGRKDDMVKIMDQRVYPGDAANSIAAVLDIHPVFVVPVCGKSGADSLVAFHASSDWQDREGEAIKYLRAALPAHMVPRRLIALDEFPVTLSGKIARAALVEQAKKILFNK